MTLLHSQLDFNISLVLGHTLLTEAKNFYSPDGVVDDARNGGDAPAQPVGESTSQMLQAYIQHLPQLLQTTTANVLPTEQGIFNAQAQIAPQQQQLNADLFSKYLPQYANASSQAELGQFQGSGGQAALAAQSVIKQLDPEYFAGREAAGNQLTGLLNSFGNPGQLSEGEMANTERGLNRMNIQSGNFATPGANGTNAISAAMGFGNALNSKRNAVANAISSAAQSLPSFRSGSDAFAQATGRSGTQSFGNQGFNTTQSGFGGNALGLSNSLLGQTGQLTQQQNDINSQRRDSLDRTTGTLSSLPT